MITARIGFSRRDSEPSQPSDIAVPGYPDNRIALQECQIANARQCDTLLDREGFQLVQHESRFADVRDKLALARDYHEEMAEFLKDCLGAAVVRPSGGSALLVRLGEHLIGRRELERPTDIIDDRIPASFAHIDYFPQVARASASYMNPPERYSRMMIAQTWRAVSDAPQDVPLAICDRRTLDNSDISPQRGILAPENSEGLADPSFTIGGIHYNPAQQWHYFPEMGAGEVLLFTGYDSAHADGWKAGHAAFDNRHSHPAALPRVSIEARFYAFFD